MKRMRFLILALVVTALLFGTFEMSAASATERYGNTVSQDSQSGTWSETLGLAVVATATIVVVLVGSYIAGYWEHKGEIDPKISRIAHLVVGTLWHMVCVVALYVFGACFFCIEKWKAHHEKPHRP